MHHLNCKSDEILKINKTASNYSEISKSDEINTIKMKIRNRKKTSGNLENSDTINNKTQSEESSIELFLLDSKLIDTAEIIINKRSIDNENLNFSDEEVKSIEDNRIQFARAHWMQMHKVNVTVIF